MPAIVPPDAWHPPGDRAKCLAVAIGPQLEPFGKDGPHPWTKVDTRFPRPDGADVLGGAGGTIGRARKQSAQR